MQETLAITHNYVSSANLAHVLDFLGSRREDLVSGCAPHARASLHDRFSAALQTQKPEVLAAAQLSPSKLQQAPVHCLAHLFDQPAAGDSRSSNKGHVFSFF